MPSFRLIFIASIIQVASLKKGFFGHLKQLLVYFMKLAECCWFCKELLHSCSLAGMSVLGENVPKVLSLA